MWVSDGSSPGHLSSGSGEGDEQLGRCPQQDLVITPSESCQGNFRVTEGILCFSVNICKTSVGAVVYLLWCELKTWSWFIYLNKRKGRCYHLLWFTTMKEASIIQDFLWIGPRVIQELFYGQVWRCSKHNYATVLGISDQNAGQLLYVMWPDIGII